MSKQPKIAVLKTNPNDVFSDYKKLMHLAEYQKALKKQYETIIKLNLSWTLYYPACSTEPWQLDAVLRTMQADGYMGGHIDRYKKIIPVEHRTVVTDVMEGARQNKWLPILPKRPYSRYMSLNAK